MITAIEIKNFKNIKESTFKLKPLTILAGTNSSGKSSIIQSLLFYVQAISNNNVLQEYLDYLGDMRSLLCVHAEEKMITITPFIDHVKISPYRMDEESQQIESQNHLSDTKQEVFLFEKNLFYLSANRIGQENIARMKKDLKSGVSGEYLFGFYESNKNRALYNSALIAEGSSSNTLSAQVTYWIEKILDLKLYLRTEMIDKANIKVFFSNDVIKEISPFNLGAGVSYLTKILILGLSLEKGNILIVENPEVHLHPKAIAQFAHFFVFLARAGIQVILETHFEHILNAMRYAVFKQNLSADQIQIYYCAHIHDPFIPIMIDAQKAKYVIDNEIQDFPKGFFDSDLNELMEML